jgi:hypothetical protein
MPGSDRALRVSGSVIFVNGGWSASLKGTEGNSGINPKMLSLDLVLEPPANGSAVTDALTPCAVEWSIDNPPIDYEQVEFRIVGTEDEPPPVLDIEHPE